MVPLVKAGLFFNWTDPIPEAMKRLDAMAEILCSADAPDLASSLHWQMQVVKRHPPATTRQLDDLAALSRLMADCGLVSWQTAADLQVERKHPKKKRALTEQEKKIADELTWSFEVLEGWRTGLRVTAIQMRALRYVCSLSLWFKALDWGDKSLRLLRTFYDDLLVELEKYGELFLQYRKQNFLSPAVYNAADNSVKSWASRMEFEYHLMREVSDAYEPDSNNAIMLESIRVILKTFVRPEDIPRALLIDYYRLRKRLESLQLLVGRTQKH